MLLSLTWGSSFLLIAVAIEGLDPAVIPFGRSVLGGLAVLFFPSARRGVPTKDLPRIAILGLIWMAIPFWLFPMAERTVASSVAGIINGALPVVMATVTALWVGRAPSAKRVGVILLGFLGVIAVIIPALKNDGVSDMPLATTSGVALLITAIICYAIGANIARPLQAKLSSACLFLWVQLAASIWTFPFAVLGIRDSVFVWSSVLALLTLGVFGTGIAFVAFGQLLQRTGLTRAMIPTYFTPIVGLLLGEIFRSEALTSFSLLGMFIIIVSAWLTSKPDDRDVMLTD